MLFVLPTDGVLSSRLMNGTRDTFLCFPGSSVDQEGVTAECALTSELAGLIRFSRFQESPFEVMGDPGSTFRNSSRRQLRT